MPFWSGDTLEQRLEEQNLIRPFDKKQIDCAAYTLRMGREAYVTPDQRASKFSRLKTKILRLNEGEDFVIPAGQFAYLLTEEYVQIPADAVAFISIKTTYKFKGLMNVSGFHVDPGFKGNLIYAVYNAGPSEVRLAQGMDLFLIWYADLDTESEKHIRKKDEQTSISPNILVSGQILSLQSLQSEIGKFDNKLFRIYTVNAAVIAVVFFILGAALRGPVTDWMDQIFHGSKPGGQVESSTPPAKPLRKPEKSQ